MLRFKTNTLTHLAFLPFSWLKLMCTIIESIVQAWKYFKKLINKKTLPPHTRASGCVWLHSSPDIQLQGSIMWDFCLKTDSLRALEPNFDMQQILFLLFLCLNPYLSLLPANAFHFTEALHLCHSQRTNAVKPFVLNSKCISGAAERADQWIQSVWALWQLRRPSLEIRNQTRWYLSGPPPPPHTSVEQTSGGTTQECRPQQLRSVMTTTPSGHKRFWAGGILFVSSERWKVA